MAFVIHEFIKSAQPVGSNLLSEKSGFGLSSATYRNELSSLEDEGYLVQPHTSAGRVPTEKAYKLYADQFLHQLPVNMDSASEFKLGLRKELETNELLKSVARQLVEKSQETVILALNKNSVYYTGLSNLFSKPEFADQQAVVSMGAVVDQIDLVIDKVFNKISDFEVKIGTGNPFGSQCSVIIGKYKLKNKDEGMFAILGPMRMDYEKNIALLSQVKKLVEGIE